MTNGIAPNNTVSVPKWTTTSNPDPFIQLVPAAPAVSAPAAAQMNLPEDRADLSTQHKGSFWGTAFKTLLALVIAGAAIVLLKRNVKYFNVEAKEQAGVFRNTVAGIAKFVDETLWQKIICAPYNMLKGS